MTIAQNSDGYSIDPYAVRPGTSAALTARTIDATQRPPLMKAQAAVVAAVPRILDTVPPPLLGGTLGLTVLAVMVASQRVHFKLVPVLTAAVLMLPVSNYHAAQKPAEIQAVAASVRERPRTVDGYTWENRYPRDVDGNDSRDRRQHDWEEDEAVPAYTPEAPDVSATPNEFLIPPEITEGVAPLVEMVVPEEWTDEEQLRVLRRRAEKLMEEIRKLRLEQELQEQRQSLSHGIYQ
ncbi:MAG: hypothetical protein ABIS15_06905 [Gemmatimonadaceae bacterium]